MANLPKIEPDTPRVGFVGTGVMGLSMAGHLQNAGVHLWVFNRTQSKARPLLDQGATWCKSAGEMAGQVDVLFSIVGFPQDVQSIYLDSGGILDQVKGGSVICDMTTSKPSLAKEIAEKAAAKGVTSLDAPVSGGDRGAREATLAIMVGGTEEGFECLKPLWECMGKNIVHMGAAGAGQHTKMCNQTVIAGKMLGMIEGLRYAKCAGLDLNTVLKAIGSGAAGSWSLDNLAPRIVDDNFDPGFFIKHFIKDMAIAQAEADQMKVSTPGLDKALEYYRKAEGAGYGELGTHGLYKAWEDNPEW